MAKDNWLEKTIDKLQEKRLAQVADNGKPPICWTMAELYKDGNDGKACRISKDCRKGLMQKMQAYLEAQGVTENMVKPELVQNNSYLIIPLKDGRQIRIMDQLPYGEPVKSDYIIMPGNSGPRVVTQKNDFEREDPRGGERKICKMQVSIYPPYQTLSAALKNGDITPDTAHEQISELKKRLSKHGLKLWDMPWLQNFGVKNGSKGKEVFVAFDGAVCKKSDHNAAPFIPYTDANVTYKVLGEGGAEKLMDSLRKAAEGKYAEQVNEGKKSSVREI